MIRPLSVLYEDPFCLAVVKPAGQFTQGTWAPPGEETLEQAVRRHLEPDAPEKAYVGIVHRLDRPVSGILLWAKTQKAARRLSMQFEARRVVKEYWAIVELSDASSVQGRNSIDQISPDRLGATEALTWEDWLTAAGPDGKVRIVPPNSPNSREARTEVWPHVSSAPAATLAWLQMWPHTGRTHQLRIQAASRGLPIVGDLLYGATQEYAIANGIALHARGLKIRHPVDHSEMNLQAPPPEAWSKLAREVALHSGPGQGH